MKIRKYLSSDMKEGMARVKKDLGREAVILHSRRVKRKGILGYFTPRQIEIIAAVDPKPKEAPANGLMLQKFNEKEKEMSAMAEEIEALKSRVMEISTETSQDNQDEGAGKKTTRKKSSSYWRTYLEHHDLDPNLLEEIFIEAESDAAGPGRMSHSKMAEILKEKAAGKIICTNGCNSRTQVFIGPTGVGKTTTLAKLAARLALQENEKVGLITIDHYRIGAVDQLQAYSEIMELPLEVVMAPQDLFKSMMRLEGCDRILVDTAGRSTGSKEQLEDLASYIDMLLPADIHLVISATTRRQDVSHIAESFKKLKYNRLIVTKLDETNVYGAVMNSSYYTKMPLVYLTDGQRVPEDLQLASELDVAGLLWRTG